MTTDNKKRASCRDITLRILLALLPATLSVSALGANDTEFESFDLNQDKGLSTSEFVAAKYSIADFKAADNDKNQSVSASEFASFKTALSKPQERQNSGPHPPRG